MNLDLSPQESALSELDLFHGYATEEGDYRDGRQRAFQAAAIQAFEFTYELGHKVLRRYITATEPSPPLIEKLSFPDLIRTAHDRGIVLGGWKAWSEYRRLRSLTSHTYHAGYAAAVFEGIPVFIDEIRHMLAAMLRSPAP